MRHDAFLAFGWFSFRVRRTIDTAWVRHDVLAVHLQAYYNDEVFLDWERRRVSENPSMAEVDAFDIGG